MKPGGFHARRGLKRPARLMMVAVLLAGMGACKSDGPKVAEVYPCEPKTSDANSSITVAVTDSAKTEIEGARVLLDPYGQEKITNRFGGVCFGNLRVRGEDQDQICATVRQSWRGRTFRVTRAPPSRLVHRRGPQDYVRREARLTTQPDIGEAVLAEALLGDGECYEHALTR